MSAPAPGPVATIGVVVPARDEEATLPATLGLLLDVFAWPRILFRCPAFTLAMASVCFCAWKSQGFVWVGGQ